MVGEGNSRSGMDKLPHDIIHNILSRLPITSLIQFGCVCRGWHTLSHDSHISRPKESNRCLVFACDQLYFIEFPDDNGGGRVRKFYPPFCASMPKYKVVCSCDGLLCIADSSCNKAAYIYNPFTGNYKELPSPEPSQHGETIVGFGFHPMINEYKVVKMVYRIRNDGRRLSNGAASLGSFHCEIQVFGLGGDIWRSAGKVPYLLDLQSSESPLVDGRLHWVTAPSFGGRKIISFDLADEQFREVPTPDDCAGIGYHRYPLAVVRGCLAAAVYCRNGDSEIWAMREYNVKESWAKEFNIRGYTPNLESPSLEQSHLRRPVRIICLLKNDEILVEYEGATLASYDPKSGYFKNLSFHGMPNLFRTILHTGSINWIDIPV
ncbi:hypothetical protein RJ639_011243 [Escallonia herrerae]|uniref:F-box domain-containing protein n=1 Tax=Escallonia herrerae TaxID=1293975 RepID=A0AA89AUG1_9ASTE|nr:hypothetical protein RJ639_011243 [Escallonia herrerae]